MVLSLRLYWDADDDVDVEDIRRYTNGGFHPIRLGDVLSSPKTQYRVLHKLGRGSFSTVWLAETFHPSQRYVALKICVANADPKHELEIFSRVSGLPNVVQLQDHLSLQGPNGAHTVLVFNVLGNLRSVIKSSKGPQHNLVRKLCHDITLGLAALHRQGIVHGDLYIGNIGISLPSLNNHPPGDILDDFGNPQCTIVLPTTWQSAHAGAIPPYLVPPISVTDYLIANDKNAFDAPHAEIMDLGNAIIVGEQVRPVCTPAAVCAPELLFELFVRPGPRSPPTRASDIWSLACTIFELVFGRRLFEFLLEITLLGMMATFCGEVPQEWKGYWESEKRLRDLTISHATAEAEWNDMLEHFTEGSQGTHTRCDVEELFALLRSMLTLDPTRRPSAEEISKHPWFSRDETA